MDGNGHGQELHKIEERKIQTSNANKNQELRVSKFEERSELAIRDRLKLKFASDVEFMLKFNSLFELQGNSEHELSESGRV